MRVYANGRKQIKEKIIKNTSTIITAVNETTWDWSKINKGKCCNLKDGISEMNLEKNNSNFNWLSNWLLVRLLKQKLSTQICTWMRLCRHNLSKNIMCDILRLSAANAGFFLADFSGQCLLISGLLTMANARSFQWPMLACFIHFYTFLMNNGLLLLSCTCIL